MNRGYVKIYRCIEDDPLWTDNREPFCKRAAWIDLILQANHKDSSFIMGMQKISVRRGQKWTSSIKLAERWGWSRKKVMAYLRLLESDGKVWIETTKKGQLITIVNYDVYQGFLKGRGTTGDTTDDTTDAHQQEQQPTQQMRTNNNVKNDIKNDIKNEKKPAAHSGFFVEE